MFHQAAADFLPEPFGHEVIDFACGDHGLHELQGFGGHAKARQARWQSIAEAAAKQSKRRIVPEVGAVCTLKEALEQTKQMDLKLIPYELSEGMMRTRKLIESAAPGQEIGVFIGPEGGFEEAEVALAMQSGFMPVTLGQRILRTETAGLTVMAWLMYQLEDSGIS